MTTKDEALKLALDDLIAEYHMEQSSFAKRVDDIFKQALAAPVREPNIGALGMPVNVPVTAPGSASRSANSAESFCKQCHGLGYYDVGHENDDGSMSGGNYVDCEKCKPSATDDNTEELLIDAMRSTMAVAYGYLWHITTSDKRVNGARKMLMQMIQASGLTEEKFRKVLKYGIQQAKNDGCILSARETNWMGQK